LVPDRANAENVEAKSTFRIPNWLWFHCGSNNSGPKMQMMDVNYQRINDLATVVSSPEKAAVGGPVPSLATMFSHRQKHRTLTLEFASARRPLNIRRR
jgi:hypothetical protein